MLRKAPIFAVLVCLGSWFGSNMVAAQDGDDSPRPTLSDRLEQFRRTLVGDLEPKQKQPSRTTRSSSTRRTTSSRQSMYGPPPAVADEHAAAPQRYEAVDGVRTDQRPAAPQQPMPAVAGATRPGAPLPSSRRTAAARTEAADTGPSQPLDSASIPDETQFDRSRQAAPPVATDPGAYGAAETITRPSEPAPPRGRETVAHRMARSEGLSGSRGVIGPPPARQPVAPARPAEPADNVIFTHTSPILSVETTGPRKITVGKEATYKVLVKNAGDVPAADVIVAIAVPEFAEVVDTIATAGSTRPPAEGRASEGIQWRLGGLAAHTKEELTLQIVPHKSESFDLAVRWTQSPQASAATVEVQEPKLEISLAGAKEVLFGEKEVYKITMSNPGTGDAENVTIHLMPLTPGDKSVASHRIGTIKAGANKAVEVELIARQAGHLSIRAEATASGDLKAMLAEDILVRRAALQLAIAGPKVQYAGTPAAYEVRASNPGDAVARHVQVTCKLPPQAEFVSATGNGQPNPARSEVVWTLDGLQAGGEEAFVVKCALKAGGANAVEAAAMADGELKAAGAVTTQVEMVADLVLDVTDPAGPIPIGQEMAYEVKVRNRGTKSAESVEITAYFSKGIEPISVEGGRFEISPGTVVIQAIGSLDAGGEVVYKIKARAEQPGNHRFRAELNCKPLGTKLTQEETTLFYGDDVAGAAGK